MFWVEEKKTYVLFIYLFMCVCTKILRCFRYCSLKNLHKCRAEFCAVGNLRVAIPFIYFFVVFFVLFLSALPISLSLSLSCRVLGLHPHCAICCLHICEARSQINWVVCARLLCGQANKPSSQVKYA